MAVRCRAVMRKVGWMGASRGVMQMLGVNQQEVSDDELTRRRGDGQRPGRQGGDQGKRDCECVLLEYETRLMVIMEINIYRSGRWQTYGRCDAPVLGKSSRLPMPPPPPSPSTRAEPRSYTLASNC